MLTAKEAKKISIQAIPKRVQYELNYIYTYIKNACEEGKTCLTVDLRLSENKNLKGEVLEQVISDLTENGYKVVVQKMFWYNLWMDIYW